jgi:hypothetical protein
MRCCSRGDAHDPRADSGVALVLKMILAKVVLLLLLLLVMALFSLVCSTVIQRHFHRPYSLWSALLSCHLAPFRMLQRRANHTLLAGKSHTVAVTRGGAVFCWGKGKYGKSHV